MKAYTNIEQSKRLSEILPLESADMFYRDSNSDDVKLMWEHVAPKVTTPCWSLAALLEQFEDTVGLAKDYGLWFCYDNRKSYCTKHHDNPVDACVEMILKLKEKDLLCYQA